MLDWLEDGSEGTGVGRKKDLMLRGVRSVVGVGGNFMGRSGGLVSGTPPDNRNLGHPISFFFVRSFDVFAIRMKEKERRRKGEGKEKEKSKLTISTIDAPKGIIFTLSPRSSESPGSCRVSSGAAMLIKAKLRSPRANVNIVLRTMVWCGSVI